ncbi:MAG: tRNA (guanosine(46)-N7)-methyltransferase TrmB [Candidatus Omnitrophica bacterium]|nr:tRNA (guanosine(46)-N7)-methyltransferase TrmB [Candidatus Omnitrophota bacterium]
MKKFQFDTTPLIPCSRFSLPLDWNKEFKRDSPLDVEIGFGMGEFLLRSALQNPGRDYIGIESDWERVYKTLKRISREGKGEIKNIRILKLDAKIVFRYVFSGRIIDNIYCLFPCPWPKKAHVKHRLFSRDFLNLVNNRLKDTGRLRIVTDSKMFALWVVEEARNTGFDRTEEEIDAVYDTKYERKWKAQGQEKFFELDFVKNKHKIIKTAKEHVLESYKLKDFNPDKFEFKDLTGKITVILKDFIFDKIRNKGLLYFIVSEKELTQHFRIFIDRRNEKWYFSKADGQTIFPTEGLKLALKMAYEAALATVKE